MISLAIAIHLILYLLVGVLVGLMSGMTGLGGGVIIVPALLFIFKHILHLPDDLAIHLASGTSLAIILLTAQATVRIYYKLRNILWAVYRRLAGGIFIGTFIGVILSNYLPAHWLEKMLAIFLIFIAIKMFFHSPKTKASLYHPAIWLDTAVGSFVGLISGLLGIGGGVLIVPYLSHCGIEIKKIIPISALCIMTVAFVGAVTFMITGFHVAGLPAYSTGFVYWPAVLCITIPSVFSTSLGVRLTYVLSQTQLKYIFITILLITSIQLLL